MSLEAIAPSADQMSIEVRLQLSELRYQQMVSRIARSESEAATYAGERQYFQGLVEQGKEQVLSLIAEIEKRDAEIAALKAEINARAASAN